MPRLEYFVAAGGVALDQLTGRLSIFDVYIEVRPLRLPAVFSRLVCVASFLVEDEDIGQNFEFVVRYTTPSGQQPTQHMMPFVGRERHQNMIANWVGVPIDQPGDLRFEALLNGEHRADHIITVHPPGGARQEGVLLYPPPQPAGVGA